MGSPDPTETLSRLFARAPFLSPTFGNKLLESRKQIIRRGICQMLYMSNIPIPFNFTRKKVRSSRQIENRGFFSSILSKLSFHTSVICDKVQAADYRQIQNLIKL